MCKVRRLCLAAAALAALSAPAFADIVTLNSGERIEGKVIAETDQDLTIDVRVSPTITDHRVVAKADVSKVVKFGEDEEAYQEIAKIQVGANSRVVAQYDASIAALKGFLTLHSTSPRAPEVQKVMDDLIAEKNRVAAGEAKINGRWLSKDEAQKEKLQMGGQQALEYMKTQAAAGDITGALDTFVLLEKNFPGVKAIPDAIELAKPLLIGLVSAAQRGLATQKVIKAEREKGIAATNPANRVEMIAAYQRSQAQAEAAVQAAQAAGKWPPLIAISEKSLTAVETKAASELKRLQALPVAKMRASIQLEERAADEIAAREFDVASATLKEAIALWPVNELAKRRQVELEKLIQEKAKADAATPPPTPARK